MIQLFSATAAMFTDTSRNRVDVEIQFRKSNTDRVTKPCGGGGAYGYACAILLSQKRK